MENLMAVKELERGREFAKQLRGLIYQEDYYEYDDKAKVVDSAEDLVAKVLDSFTTTLSLFNHHNVSAESSFSSSSFSQHFPSNFDGSHDESPKSKTRRSPTSSSIKDPSRSSPKKRKNTVQTWVDESKMSLKDDGYAWRKYGQKIILNTKHPRNYFRCTHKYDQGCEATKQVQKIQENPPLYRTTYFGHHTCTNLLNPLSFLDDSHEHLNPSSSYILSFDKNHNNNNNLITTFDPKVNNNNNNTTSFLIQQNHNNHFPSSGSLFPSSGSIKNEKQFHNIKQEKKNYNNNDKIINVVVPSCSPNDCLVSPHDQEAVLSPFGSGDGDQVDVFDSPIFYDDPLVFEDLLKII